MAKEALLVLNHGQVFQGRLHGANQETSGEVIFNTSMMGYQEILSDPSYTGQIVTMTYPHIGNYGVTSEDMESRGIHAAGLVVKELSSISSNWRSEQDLKDWLEANQVLILEGVDTRALVKVIRSQGECLGIIAPKPETSEALEIFKRRAASLPSMEGQDLAKVVSTKELYSWPVNSKYHASPLFKVVAYDFGIKHMILKMMADLGMEVTVVPHDTPAEEVVAMNPDGVFLSNGPGDPAVVQCAIESVQSLLGRIPIFGICLGHQILSLALGCRTYKLACGHHGGNHPVMDYATNKIEITSHNHGFAVDEASLPEQVQVTHRNLNDQTVEGIESTRFPAYSVQYHPEAAPGPHDACYLFDRFVELMKAHQTS